MHRSASLVSFGSKGRRRLPGSDSALCHAAHPPTRGWHAMFCEAVLGLEMVCLCWGEGGDVPGGPEAHVRLDFSRPCAR